LFERYDPKTKDRVLVAANMGGKPQTFDLPISCKNALTGAKIGNSVTIEPKSCIVMEQTEGFVPW